MLTHSREPIKKFYNFVGDSSEMADHHGMATQQIMFSSKANLKGNNVFHSKNLPLVTWDPYIQKANPKTGKLRRGTYTEGVHNYPLPENWSFLDGVPGIPTNLPINWEKLPFSSDFKILLFIAELKDTLALFTAKFWKELTYGSLTWGVVPFIGEIQAIAETLAKLSTYGVDAESYPYEDTLDIQVDYVQPKTLIRGTLTYRLSGTLSFEAIPVIYKLYDAIGFHPDVETYWDSIPLSFIMNQFLPIHTLIDDIVDQGWVSHANFNGWWSKKFVGEHSKTVTSWGLTTGFPFSVYQRGMALGSVAETYYPPSLPQAELPRSVDMFNAFYLIQGSKDPSKLRKKAVDLLGLGLSGYDFVLKLGQNNSDLVPPQIYNKILTKLTPSFLTPND
jgi:hypothetical protein